MLETCINNWRKQLLAFYSYDVLAEGFTITPQVRPDDMTISPGETWWYGEAVNLETKWLCKVEVQA